MGLCEKRVGPRTFSVPGFSGVKLRMSGAAVKSGVKRPKSLRPNVFVRECERILARAAKSRRRQREANVYTCCINLSRAISYTLYRRRDRKSTRLNSSHQIISYAVFCLKKKRKTVAFLDT